MYAECPFPETTNSTKDELGLDDSNDIYASPKDSTFTTSITDTRSAKYLAIWALNASQRELSLCAANLLDSIIHQAQVQHDLYLFFQQGGCTAGEVTNLNTGASSP